MAQEDRKCSSGSGGGAGGGGVGGGSVGSSTRSSKKQKQKKPPQRGLGVAQLERLRLEEQQRKDPSSFPPPPTFNSFCLSASLPNIRAESEFGPSSSLFRHIPSVPNMNLAAASPVPSQGSRNYCEGDGEMRNLSANRKPERGSKLSSPLESYNVLAGHELLQRVGSNHPPLLVNASPVSSMSSYQMEPPSNQSHRHGNLFQFRPQEEKMLSGGAKRSHPLSLANPPGSLFPFKLPKMGNPINRPEGLSIDNLREGPSLSCSILESSSTESVKQNKVSGGEFLTLAPPLDTSPLQSWPYSQDFASRSYCSYPRLEFTPSPGYPEGLNYGHQRLHQPIQQRQYYGFLPSTMPRINVENRQVNGRSNDPSGSIDLDLKL